MQMEALTCDRNCVILIKRSVNVTQRQQHCAVCFPCRHRLLKAASRYCEKHPINILNVGSSTPVCTADQRTFDVPLNNACVRLAKMALFTKILPFNTNPISLRSLSRFIEIIDDATTKKDPSYGIEDVKPLPSFIPPQI